MLTPEELSEQIAFLDDLSETLYGWSEEIYAGKWSANQYSRLSEEANMCKKKAQPMPAADRT